MGAPAFLDNSTDGASNTAYAIANARIAHQAVESPVPTGIWRSVAHSQNAFFTESFIDECAAAAGRDPVAFQDRRDAVAQRWVSQLDAGHVDRHRELLIEPVGVRPGRVLGLLERRDRVIPNHRHIVATAPADERGHLTPESAAGSALKRVSGYD